MQNNNQNRKNQPKVIGSANIQNIEQRSIPVFSDRDTPQSLPRVKLDVSIHHKTKEDRDALNKLKTDFDLQGWNERNRPGNNKNKLAA